MDLSKMELLFKDEDHVRAYAKIYAKMKKSFFPNTNKAIAYLIALDEVTREHAEEMYDFKRDCFENDCLSCDWQTEITLKLTRLASNLWNGSCKGNAVNYSPYNIFDCNYAVYFIEALKISFSPFIEE